jgi:hypothetical protein
VIGRRLPEDLASGEIAPHDRKREVGGPCPEKDLAGASQFPEFAEQHADRAGDALVRVNFNPSGLVPAVAGRQGEPQLASASFTVPGLDAALAQQAELVLRHRSLQAKQKPIVDQPRIVNPVGINDQRPGQGTEVNEVVPIPAVAGQP